VRGARGLRLARERGRLEARVRSGERAHGGPRERTQRGVGRVLREEPQREEAREALGGIALE
jgi:hypothetical protein